MNIVIIGASAAGLSCLHTLCTISPHANITVISAERYSPYRRCLLPDYLSNAITEQELTIGAPSDYPSNVHFIMGQKAEQIDAQRKTVRLSDGRELGYDILLLAVGADALQPKYYAEGRRTFTLRSLDDAKNIANIAKGRAVVLGGGFAGIQTAYALHERNIKTEMVITSRHPLASVLDKESARYIEQDLHDMGIGITTRDDVADITWHKNQLKVYLSSGIALETDVVVVCKGFTPSVDLAKVSGIKVNEGIAVNEYCETSAAHIFAAGDCCETMDLARKKAHIIGLWPVAVAQALCAALNMSGTRSRYPGSIWINSLKTRAFHFIAAGVLKGEPGLTIYEKYLPTRKQFRKIALRDDVPVGMAFYNCPEEACLFANVIKHAIPLTVNPQKIVNGDVSIRDLINYLLSRFALR